MTKSDALAAKILVVENDPRFAESVAETLRSQGYQGAQAVSAAASLGSPKSDSADAAALDASPQDLFCSMIHASAGQLTQDALRETQEFLTRLLEHSPALIYVTTVDGHRCVVNRAWEELFQLPREQVVGRTLEQIFPPELARRFRDQNQTIIETLAPITVEEEVDAPDGRHSMYTVKFPLCNAAKQVEAIGGISLDISQHKQAIDELQHQKEILQTIFDHIPLMINLIDCNGHVRLVNRQWERVLGWSAEEALSHDIVAECYPDPEYRQEVLRYILQPPGPWRDFKTRIRDGSILDTAWTTVPLSDGTTIGIGQDVTDRRRAEESLRQLAAIVESSGDAIYSLTPDGTIVSWNASAERIFGYSAAEIIGRSVVVLRAHSQPSEFDEILSRIHQGASIKALETVRRHKDGRDIMVSSTISPIKDAAGRIISLSVVARDITEIIRSEKEARERQAQLAHVMRLNTMGKIVAEMAHEINQPLYAIVNYAAACAGRLHDQRPEVPAEIAGWIQQISEQANRAGQIVQRLGRFTRKEPPRRSTVSTSELIHNALGLVEMDARLRKVRLRAELDERPAFVLVDPIQIEQVIVNLILNAIESFDDATREERAVVVAWRLDGNSIEVSVRDGGSGLSDADFSRLFESYFTTKPKGMGLGLSISRSIVEAHGGRLWASKNAGRGMTFQFTLPLVSGGASGA